MTGSPDRLAALLGETPAKTLRSVLSLRNQEPVVAVPEWSASGHTGAKLVAVTVQRIVGDYQAPHTCVIKVCPPGPYGRESAKHYEAIERSPKEFSRAHLVGLAFDSISCPDGSVLLAQDIAGESLARCRPMSALTGADLTAACGAVAGALLTQWTGDGYSLSAPTTGSALLRRELREAWQSGGGLRSWGRSVDLLDPGRLWIRTAEDGVLPNPLAMALDGAPTGAFILRYLTGRTHGDLHDDNVLVPRAPDGTLQPEQFRIIDLATFEHQASLSRDIAMLLTSVVSSQARHLPGSQQTALIDYLLRADHAAVAELPPNLVAQVDALLDVHGASFVRRGHRDAWEVQRLISIQAAALVHLTFDDLGEQGRWWCLRLAARAAHRLAPTSAVHQGGALRLEPSMLTGPQAAAAVLPTGSPAKARLMPLSLGERTEIVDAMLATPAFRDPHLRQQVYDDLPDGVTQQVARDPAVRQELFNLIRACEDYSVYAPWPTLIYVLRSRFPGHPTVEALAALLFERGRVDNAEGS